MFLSDRRFFLSVSAVVLVVITVPTLWAYSTAGPEYVFGGALLNPLDANTYIAKAYQGWTGHWQFTLPYSSESSSGSFINFYYILVGQAARLLNVPLLAAYNGARILGSMLLLLALRHFYNTELPETLPRRAAFLISSLTLGMGWVLLPAGLVPADFWVAEAFPLLASLTNPHFPAALAGIVFLATPRASRFREPLTIFLDAVLAFSLAVISPFGVVIAMLPWFGLILWEIGSDMRTGKIAFRALIAREPVFRLAALFAGGLPVILYDFAVIASDPILSAWNAQNVTASPAWWDLALSFSPALILACIGFRKAPRVLVGWTVLGAVLVFIPFPLQRRFLMGLYVPLAGLAAVGVGELARLRRHLPRMVLIACFIPGPLLLLLSVRAGVEGRNPVLFLNADEKEALNWLATETDPDALVLASPEMGLFIPAYTGRRVIYGHPFETINAGAEKEGIEAYFLSQETAAQSEYLATRSVDYVFFGPREAELGVPGPAGMLETVFEDGAVLIYRVVR